ncbi:MAG: TIGR01777 family oxidoreductase [Actinomycetota bacterium]|nr:TIGR01777 family oxidoreductase [Actinomycetota bacterium]
MRVVLTGATGTIGGTVATRLQERGDRVVALARDRHRAAQRLGANVEVHEWRAPTGQLPPSEALSGADGVIHLLGEPISQRWTAAAKQRIHDSRVLSTRHLVAGLRRLPDDERPQALVSQSATGFYGPRNSQPVDESTSSGRGFLADLVAAWEAEALSAADMMRVAVTRTGVVLSEQGGALAKMLPFFRLGIGGRVAGGRQYVPWVHLEDVAAALVRCLDDDSAQGAINVTSPNPVTNAELSRALGHALGRPAFLPVPGFALHALYGEMAQLVVTGQRVVPARLERMSFDFRYPRVESALHDVLSDA